MVLSPSYMQNLLQIGIALDQYWSLQGGEPLDRRKSMTLRSKFFRTVERLGGSKRENSVEAMTAQREEKKGENSLEATPAQITSDLCIGN